MNEINDGNNWWVLRCAECNFLISLFFVCVCNSSVNLAQCLLEIEKIVLYVRIQNSSMYVGSNSEL